MAPEWYGYERTFHATTKLAIDVAPDGEVVAVWFRCLALPFEIHRVDAAVAHAMRQHVMGREGLELLAVDVERAP